MEGPANGVLALGDYKARIIPTKGVPKDASTSDVYTTYEVLLPDGKIRTYQLVGYEPPNSAASH
jgi:hypothetical protein